MSWRCDLCLYATWHPLVILQEELHEFLIELVRFFGDPLALFSLGLLGLGSVENSFLHLFV